MKYLIQILLIASGYMLIISCTRVSIDDGIMDEGQACYQINTPHATYLYQKEAGGFSSIIDKEGNDWVSFHPDSAESYPSSAAGSYRGLPNLVFGSEDSGAGHPGFRKCSSMLISDNQIRTVTKSGRWEWIWTFFKDYAELEVIKTDADHAYWFLYEGTINGKYKPHVQYWGTNTGGPLKSLPDYYFGNSVYDFWSWAYFGEEQVNRIFFVLQVDPDKLSDTFSFLGNTEEGVIAPDGMVVFGFGRAPKAEPLLTSVGKKFRIGFLEQEIKDEADHEKLYNQMSGWLDK